MDRIFLTALEFEEKKMDKMPMHITRLLIVDFQGKQAYLLLGQKLVTKVPS